MARSKQLKRLEPWHYDLIDLMIATPRLAGREAAAHFGVSPVWISIVKNSPIFRAEFERRRERMSVAVETDIAGWVTALANLSLGTMNERIKRDPRTIPTRDLIKSARIALDFLGYGRRNASPPDPSPVDVRVIVADPELLERAREKLRRFNRMQDEAEEPARALPAPQLENPVKTG